MYPISEHFSAVKSAIEEWKVDGRGFPSTLSEEILEHSVSPETLVRWTDIIKYSYVNSSLTWLEEDADIAFYQEELKGNPLDCPNLLYEAVCFENFPTNFQFYQRFNTYQQTYA